MPFFKEHKGHRRRKTLSIKARETEAAAVAIGNKDYFIALIIFSLLKKTNWF